MPAASSKPAPQTTPSEVQDTTKQLLGVVEKKIRNLEKRKTKLDGYREMVTNGKVLNKDQEEAVSHFEEVGASLEFAKELSKQFSVIMSESTRAHKREAKREKQQRHEQDLSRISDVLLLQNVLIHMGQEHVRADFLAGTNGAVHLEPEELTHLDNFFKLVSPSRESEEDSEEDGETEEDMSFDKKLENATSQLNSYLREEDKEVCNTTYKELFQLVQRIHQCGYLDNIPAAPVEAEPVAEETLSPAAPAVEQEQVEEADVGYEKNFTEVVAPSEFAEVMSEVPSESYFSGVPSAAEQMQSVQTETQQLTQGMNTDLQQPPPQPQQHQQQPSMVEMAPSTRVLDVPQAPEPIEMPPAKPVHHDVNEVLAPVLGSFNFVQDSMLDYDSPHMDPAVVAVSQQPYIPSSTFSSSAQSSSNSAVTDLSQGEPSPQQTQLDALSSQQAASDQSYQPPRYDTTPQGYPDQTYAPQTLDGGSAGGVSYGAQPELSGQVEYGSAQGSAAGGGKMNELPEFPNAPVETQQDQSSGMQSNMLSQQALSHSTTQYNTQGINPSEGYSQSLGSNQLGSDMSQGSSSSPLTITDPSQATIPLPGEQTTSDVQQSSIPTKSTMNASAPPFQMTNSLRTSPQMQGMQNTPAGQVGQSADMGYQGGMDQNTDYNHSMNRGDVNRTQSPIQDVKMDQGGGPPSDQSGNSYGYPHYYKNGRGGKPRGPNPSYRGNRGGAPFIRGGARYNAPQPPRAGPGNYNTYVHRDTFAPRGPDVSYNPNARYGGFNQVQQDQGFYNRRGGIPRGGPRGGRGAPGPRNQAPYRGGRGSFGKPSPQVSV